MNDTGAAPRPSGPAPWHLPADLAGRYAAGRLDPAQTMSVEAHLERCARCRAAIPADAGWLAASWERVADIVDRPRAGVAERLLCRCGVPQHLARLLTATPALSRAWLGSVAAVLAFAVLAGLASTFAVPVGRAGVLLAFLLLAPILPTAGIAAAYGTRVDPGHELQAATPMAGPRLLLLRALAVQVTAVTLTGLCAPFLPGPPGLVAAWVLPSLGLTAAVLALTRLVPVQPAAAGISACWAAAVLVYGGWADDLFAAFRPPAQALYAITALVLLPVLLTRYRRADHWRYR
ncbi:hypothetical protein Sru01_22890 [Sphaerisporangium rufum]|uniref:Putative zinc-finger domain-containing protein n=1 Tax=Sphaerisporangium rufum TaxID=1381558 RepID=A0A919V0D8_9ACTN|nr:zf-HC2 domain-containing protein [Sphaerisporangium rufum]GII77307.1 hypothetical protein Sru01_22890 [Sphaerisporangium rufum]